MVKINDVQPAAQVLGSKVRKANPELAEVLKAVQDFPLDVEKQVILDKPVKSLKGFLRREFKGRKTIRAKRMDDAGKTWHIMVSKVRRKKAKTGPESKEHPAPAGR